MEKLFYFAYGSNLHPFRLWQRVPSCALVGTASLTGYQLHFHKRGWDGSGKCNIWHTGNQCDEVIGAVYAINADEKERLDEAEGAGYAVPEIEVDVAGQRYMSFLYIAKQDFVAGGTEPYTWYRELVVSGARVHRFPNAYVQGLARVPAQEDQDRERARQHFDIASTTLTLPRHLG